MSKRPSWRQLTLFDDLEVAIPVTVEAPQPAATTLNQVPAIDVSLVRRRKPEKQPELDGLR